MRSDSLQVMGAKGEENLLAIMYAKLDDSFEIKNDVEQWHVWICPSWKRYCLLPAISLHQLFLCDNALVILLSADTRLFSLRVVPFHFFSPCTKVKSLQMFCYIVFFDSKRMFVVKFLCLVG